MKLSTIFAVNAVAKAQDAFNGIFDSEGSGESLLDSELSQEDKEFLSNCAMVCSDGACIQEEQKCDGKRHCVDGSDERNCQVNDDSGSDNSKKRNMINPYANRFGPPGRGPPVPVPVPAGSNLNRFRGRFPAFTLSSTFKNFDDEAFERAQRKNRKMNTYVTGGETDPRFDLMNKMLFYMSAGDLNLADYQSYGCQCSSKGRGAPVDDIDSACQRNNQCRSCTQIDWSNCSNQQAYFVNGWAQNNLDGIICVDQENTCSRALCECDLQFVKDIVSSASSWKRNRHSKFGFDQSECSSESSGGASIAARGLNQSRPSTESCCGNYPQRFPYSTGKLTVKTKF